MIPTVDAHNYRIRCVDNAITSIVELGRTFEESEDRASLEVRRALIEAEEMLVKLNALVERHQKKQAHPSNFA